MLLARDGEIRQAEPRSHSLARAAKASLYFGQSCNVAGSKSAPFGHTSVFTSGSTAT